MTISSKAIALTFFLFSLTLGSFFFITREAQAQFGSCSEYGIMAYESGGYCKCMSGYVMGKDFMGRSQCVSGDSACTDKYGYGARYDSLSGSCECRYGYVWGESMLGDSECVTEDQACKDKLGFNARSSLGGGCECSYGYVIDGGKCTNGDQVCRSDHGYRSSYNSLSNKCECDSGYTFDDDYQCVEKQNNVYFRLMDINPENDKELLIKSDYDSRKYIVRIGVGCFNSSLNRYINKNLVVNLGTDYEVDTFDTVVLQDHNQTCSIMSRQRTYEDSFPRPEEETSFALPTFFTPRSQPTYVPESNISISDAFNSDFEEEVGVELYDQNVVQQVEASDEDLLSSTATVKSIPTLEAKESIMTRIWNFFKKFF